MGRSPDSASVLSLARSAHRLDLLVGLERGCSADPAPGEPQDHALASVGTPSFGPPNVGEGAPNALAPQERANESTHHRFAEGTPPQTGARGATSGSMGAGYRSSRSTHPANSRLAGNVPLNALDNDLVATCELPPGVTCRRPGRTSVVARSRNEWSVSALTVKAQPEIARVY